MTKAAPHLRSSDWTLNLAANVYLSIIFTWLLRDILLLAFTAVLGWIVPAD